MLRLTVALLLGVVVSQTFADEPEAIVGGTGAAPREFPYQVSLNRYGSHTCGGSIISPTKILTAAHCVDTITNFDYLLILTGSIDNRRGNSYRVKDIQIHRDYKDGVEYSWRYDVAVITLVRPIQYNEDQQPVKLASNPPVPGMSCVLSGWGLTSANARNVPQMLQKMRTQLISNASCMQRHGPIPIYKDQVCAFAKWGIGACSGDSGGPLVCDGEQHGITSWVTLCAVGKPDVYTNVYEHLSFINRQMAN